MRRRTMARGLAAVPLSALVLLSACGGGDPDEAASSTSAGTTSAATTSTSTGSAEPVGSDVPTFPADTSADTGEAVPGDGPTVVTALRVGEQDGFDRVVFQVSGTAVPGWDVEYVDAPTAEGSGEPVDVPGAAYLRVTLTGTTNPYEAPGVTEVPRGPVAGAGGVQGVYNDSTFEGQSLAYVGVDAERPFRVYALEGPTRVVVDISD